MAKRVGAIMMLSIGLFVCIIAIVRVTFIGQLSPDVTSTLRAKDAVFVKSHANQDNPQRTLLSP